MNPFILPTAWRAGARRTALLGSALALAGCASLDPEAAFAPVRDAARTHLEQDLPAPGSGSDAATAQRVAALLAQPLGTDDAVQVALLNHRGLQARLQALGLADADRVQASRWPNPGFSLGRLRRGDELEIERGLHLGLAPLLGQPLAAALEASRLRGTQAEVTQYLLALADDARQAWLRAVAAEQLLVQAQQGHEAASAAAELARRMQAQGNHSPLQAAREQAQRLDAALQLARAEQARAAAREALARALGLAQGAAGVQLPAALPTLPGPPEEDADTEARALPQRLDVRAAAHQAEALALQLGLVRRNRFINLLELGVQRNSASGQPAQRGVEVRVELPLFDSGDARLAGAEARWRQALHQAAHIAVQARSEIREALAERRSRHQQARVQQEELLPLREQISQQNLLRYNGMLIGPFELLADARELRAARSAAVEALRDYWLADARLQRALRGPAGAALTGGPAGAAMDDTLAAARAATAAAAH